MTIYTLQFPTLGKMRRIQFLTFLQRSVVEFAFAHQNTFLANHLTAEFFHQDAQADKREPQDRVPVLIHALSLNGMFTLRAYKEQACDTLRLWLQLFLNENPEFSQHIVETLEHIKIQETETPVIYKSTNYIPFRDCKTVNGFYANAEKDYNQLQNKKDQPHFALQKQLFNNLGTFLFPLTGNMQRNIELLHYPAPPKRVIALRSKNKETGKIENIYKQAFTVSVKTNLNLPMVFSMGQNVGYGNGVFIREN